MKRRVLSVLLILVLALGLYCLSAPDARAIESAGQCGTGLSYVLTDSGTLFILGSGTMDNYSVSNPAPWSDYASLINSVRFNDGITNVGDYAFSGCHNLSEISDTSGVTSVGSHAFDGCYSLTNMPEGASSIGSYAFRNCASLDTAYISGSSLGEGVFYGCSSLESASLSGGISRIPSYTFYECYNMSNITLPSGLTSIGESAFDGAGIYTIDIPSGVTEIGSKAFRRSHLTGFTLPSKINEVPDRLLSDCYNLESVTIHEGVTKISTGAFSGCYALSDVNLPESLQDIGEGVFSGSGLTTVNIPKNLKAIPASAFSDCTSLVTLDIPSTIETVGDESFKGCAALNTVVVNEGVMALGNGVFADCEALESVTLPTSLRSVGDGVFTGCTSLEQVKFSGYLSRWARVQVGEDNELLSLDNISTDYIDGGNLEGGSVWSVSQNGTLYISGTGSIENFEQGSAPWRGHGNEITEVVIDNRIENLGSYCFEGLNKVKVITLPKGVTRISQGMFKDCAALETVLGMDNVKNIGDGAFENCVSLEIDIPTVLTLGNRAFAGCKALNEIILNCESIGEGAFENCAGLKQIIIRNSVRSIGSGAFAGCDPTLATFVGSQDELKALKIGANNEQLTKVLGIYYYIKNVYIGYGASKKDAMSSISDKTYHIFEVDLNGQKNGYVCVGYALTNDIVDALTDIKVLTTSLNDPAGSMAINGVNYFLLSQPISTDSEGNTTYLCTTKDRSAGEAIAMIGLTYGGKSTFTDGESWMQVVNVNGGEANLTGTDQDIRLYFTGDMTADFSQPIGGSALYVSIIAIIVTLIGGLLILWYMKKRGDNPLKPVKSVSDGESVDSGTEADISDELTEEQTPELISEPVDNDMKQESHELKEERTPELISEPVDNDMKQESHELKENQATEFTIEPIDDDAKQEIAEPTERGNTSSDKQFDITITDLSNDDIIDDEQSKQADILSDVGTKLKGIFKKEKNAAEPTELDEEPPTFKESAAEFGAKVKAFFVKVKDAIVNGFHAVIHAEIWKKLSEGVKNAANSEKPVEKKQIKPKNTDKKNASAVADKPSKKSNSWWDKRQAYDEEMARKAKAKRERDRRKARAVRRTQNRKK